MPSSRIIYYVHTQEYWLEVVEGEAEALVGWSYTATSTEMVKIQ